MMVTTAQDPVARDRLEWVMIALEGASSLVMALTSIESLFDLSNLTPIKKTVTMIQFGAGTTLTVAMVYVGVRKATRGQDERRGYHAYRPRGDGERGYRLTRVK